MEAAPRKNAEARAGGPGQAREGGAQRNPARPERAQPGGGKAPGVARPDRPGRPTPTTRPTPRGSRTRPGGVWGGAPKATRWAQPTPRLWRPSGAPPRRTGGTATAARTEQGDRTGQTAGRVLAAGRSAGQVESALEGVERADGVRCMPDECDRDSGPDPFLTDARDIPPRARRTRGWTPPRDGFYRAFESSDRGKRAGGSTSAGGSRGVELDERVESRRVGGVEAIRAGQEARPPTRHGGGHLRERGPAVGPGRSPPGGQAPGLGSPIRRIAGTTVGRSCARG